MSDKAAGKELLNYVPLELLTLRAEISENWPEILKQDADHMSNIILFQEISSIRTRLVSYGVGYRDTPEHNSLLQFFTTANEGLLESLKRYVEKGERSKFGQ